MLPVVPNFYNAISRMDSPPAQISASTSSVTRGVDQLDSLSWTSDLTASTRAVDNHDAHRFYVPSSTGRSGRGDLIRSMHILREHEHVNRNYITDDERLELLKSVNVVPKPSGAGYDVHSSSHYMYTAGNVDSSFHLTLPSIETPKNIYNTRPKTELVLSSGAKFSKNIGNPDMRKRLQEKHAVASNKITLMKSASSAEVTSNSMSSFDITSAVTESYQAHMSSTSLRPSSPLRDASFITSGLAQSFVDDVDSPLSFGISTTNRNTILPDSAQKAVFNYQEPIYTDTPKKDPSYDADTCSNTNSEAKKRPLTPKLEHELPLASPGFMSLLKNKTVMVKNNVNEKTPNTKSSPDKSKTRSSEANNIGSSYSCNCRVYHTHKFTGIACNHDVEARKEERKRLILSTLKLSSDIKKDGVDDPRYVFWIPALSFHPYRHGDAPVSFSFLWPRYRELRELLQNSGIQQTVLNADAIFDMCTLACTCGPFHLLQCLIDLHLIRKDHILESGAGLLHISVLAHNLEAIQYLMIVKIRPDIRDRQGLTADQLCYNPIVRKHLSARYLLNKDMSKDKILLKPSLQDKDTIFKMASDSRLFVDIQKKLQTLDFNVNTECDNNGDFLLHLVVKQGLSQLPLLMALVKIQGADIELCNADGMTPLMLAASAGNFVLCDVLMCLFGADPNKPNSLSGRSALHFAAEGNHRKSVECLIKRGADVNMEDHDGLRPDDSPSCVIVTDDCREIIVFNRNNRIEMLSQLVKTGEVVPTQLLPSDLCVVDSEGHTLIMIAALYNRYLILHCLLEVSKATINAQHNRTGMTALALAAGLGHVEAVSVLLRHKANPVIADMSGYLPIHHAVLKDKENVVDIILDNFPSTYTGLYKALRICKKTSIHIKLKRAWEKRQDEIVTPKLLSCALTGDAEELYKLLEEGDNINPKSATGNWPVYLAVENGNLDVLKLLLEKGGDIRKRHFTTGATALHVAAKMGHQAIVSYLLQYCKQYHKKKLISSPQFKDKRTSGASQKSKVPRNSSIPKRYMDINAMDRDNKTAVQLAAEKGFSKIVELLLSYGATTAMLDINGNLVTCPHYEGVRIIIDSHRQQHIRQIMSCIEDKSKKGLGILKQIWLPKFDHNLRDKEGNTPLMVAAKRGKIPILEFLLESAVYPEVSQYETESDTDSDTDSGMLDPTKEFSKDDDLLKSLEASPFTHSLNLPNDNKPEINNSSQLDPSDFTNSLEFFSQRRITRIVNDANKPKGLSIYHDNLVSHVCAVNLLDGTTALHQAIRTADVLNTVVLLVNADPTVLSVQDDKGETAFHTACRLNRKKSVEFILAQPDLDLNVRTRDGFLPEELTTSRAIRKSVEKSRSSITTSTTEDLPFIREPSVEGSEHSSSVRSSTVNFDKVHTLYEALKHAGGTEQPPP